ncbi:MAG: thiamine phosphate synthase [Chloroflexi bacterium]|nr:thiamine phosphate synthase [Chloroflexota bacterium]
MATLPHPTLAFVTDRTRTKGRPLADVVDAAVDGGVELVQLREKDLSHPELLTLTRELKSVIAGRALFFVNGDVDAALACGADGVQLGESGASIAGVRAKSGGLLIGRSVHSVEAAVKAEGQGADLLIAGTVFPSASHRSEPFQGVGLIERIAARVSVPVLGIGGVNADNAASVIEAGAWGCAVITAISLADDPRGAARDLKAAMLAAKPGVRTA